MSMLNQSTWIFRAAGAPWLFLKGRRDVGFTSPFLLCLNAYIPLSRAKSFPQHPQIDLTLFENRGIYGIHPYIMGLASGAILYVVDVFWQALF